MRLAIGDMGGEKTTVVGAGDRGWLGAGLPVLLLLPLMMLYVKTASFGETTPV